MALHRSIRFPDDLAALIEAEVQRKGSPWTFSSVAVAAMRAGLATPKPPDDDRVKR